jgi:holo-[acyl-carrier protein] synthase
MIRGIGVDMVDIRRMERVIGTNSRFVEKVFAESEIQYCEGRVKRAQHYAARFAAKEACFKALGTGWRQGMGWQEIVVENDGLGKPSIRLTGKTLEVFKRRGGTAIHLSLAHEKAYALAFVLIE